ncbi:YwqH-like family protein [Pseudobutyrivibrio xylanivorans]|uniref:DUF5082 domain-containing protein n=1 Tax=Pseudobutyrivibrio xylanivorans TaxID=185007 RepID=A0A5P6VQC1_PSEXY|nr:DUF5082 family protein [Pseudobutyrivibrio xylanivorans]QFJ54670.1 DUF5082 domain-containing protein [Pseudobutyrivibrio xylanivorans]
MSLIDDLYSKINNLRAGINSNNAKIERLKTVKSEIKEDKELIEGYKKRWSDNICAPLAEDTTWYGNNKNKVVECATDGVSAEYTTFINNTDQVLDAICDKITQLENQNAEWLGIIGDCYSAINNLLNEIEKACN